MSVPFDVQKSIDEIDGYLFSIMNMVDVMGSSNDDGIRGASIPLSFMGGGVIEHWDVLKEYLQRRSVAPSVTLVNSLPVSPISGPKN